MKVPISLEAKCTATCKFLMLLDRALKNGVRRSILRHIYFTTIKRKTSAQASTPHRALPWHAAWASGDGSVSASSFSQSDLQATSPASRPHVASWLALNLLGTSVRHDSGKAPSKWRHSPSIALTHDRTTAEARRQTMTCSVRTSVEGTFVTITSHGLPPLRQAPRRHSAHQASGDA